LATSRQSKAHFGLPWVRPGTIAVNVTWMKRGFNAGQTLRSMYPSIFNRFPVIQPVSSKVVSSLFGDFLPCRQSLYHMRYPAVKGGVPIVLIAASIYGRLTGLTNSVQLIQKLAFLADRQQTNCVKTHDDNVA